jgi:subtilisin-like proprotein convertase family protein
VTVAVVDDGVQYTHPDLAANYDAADSYDFNDGDANPAPSVSNGDFHGTHVAGLIAARANNGIGVSGVAPLAKFAGLRLVAADTTDAQEAAALAYRNDALSVYSNSWGPEDDAKRLEGPGSMTLAAIQNSIATGRGGKGSIYVWAAGNGLGAKDNVNYDGYANSRYVIATTGLNASGKQASYSEPGAPIFVAAFGGDSPALTTTDLVGLAGDGVGDYVNNFDGTSAAAPEVSGVVALMLEANPNLTWRDVKHVLADTAIKNDPTDAGWVRNGAGHWVSHKYGFGQVDAAAAVRAAIGWQNVAAEQVVTSGTIAVNKVIPDNNANTGAWSVANVDALLKVETVEVLLNATVPHRGDLRVVLTSPDGTQSVLAEPHADTAADYASWTLTSTHHWDEISRGQWTLKVTDEKSGYVGTFDSWKLNLYGTPVAGQNYVSLATNATVGGQDFGDRPLPGARLTAAGFPLSGGAQRLVFGFDNDVSGGISADDLELFNQTTGATVPAGATALAYDPATRTATWTFPGVPRGVLANGDYVARLKADRVTLADGGMLDGNGDGMGGDDFTFRFTFLQGDMNGDRTVDSADLSILLRNLGTAATGWDHGDLDFDGTVGFVDYQVMQRAYNGSLPAAPAAANDGSMLSVEAVTAPVVAKTITVATATAPPVVTAKPVTVASPRPVAPPVFSVRALKRRDVDLLDSPSQKA